LHLAIFGSRIAQLFPSPLFSPLLLLLLLLVVEILKSQCPVAFSAYPHYTGLLRIFACC
jgi:hypothetical protein